MKIESAYSNEFIQMANKKMLDLQNLPTGISGHCIFTKGAFDLFHFGHLSLFAYLQSIKKESNCVTVVAVTSDRIVKLKKGNNRPINPQQERFLQIALLPQVDYIFIHDELDHSDAIVLLQPNIYIKGIDTAGGVGSMEEMFKANPEFELMHEDSTISIFCDDGNISSSIIINRIVQASIN